MEQQLAQGEAHLRRYDPVMGRLITEHGSFTPRPHTDYYWELVDSIISQQLSVKAARTIEQRFLALFDGRVPSAEQLLNTSTETLRGVGMSGAKARYVLDLAQHVHEGTLKIADLPNLNNEEIIKELTAVKGIGEWTAHMFLIFALGRLDVLPVGDLGIRSGMQKLYGLDHLPTPTEVRQVAEQRHWHPFESVASWYIWQALDNA